jgi:hypothetical protein
VIVLAAFLGLWAGVLAAFCWIVWREWRRDQRMRAMEARAESLAERAHGLPPGSPDVLPLWTRGNHRDIGSRWPR